MGKENEKRVVASRPYVGRWCACIGEKPAGDPQITPGMAGRLIHEGKEESTVFFDHLPAPVILPSSHIQANPLEARIVKGK